MKTYWGGGGIAPRILDLGTRWRRPHHTPKPIPVYIEDERVWHVADMGEIRSLQNILTGEPEEERPLERPRHR